MKSVLVFLGRVWRYSNRFISRLYVQLFSPKTDHPMVRLGSLQNGWYAPRDMPPNALIYCIGVGRDATFDFELSALGAQVHSFDPTPPAVEYMAENNQGRVTFHQWGVLDKDSTMRLYYPLSGEHGSYFIHDLHRTEKYYEVPCYRLNTILNSLGHSDIYLMKMDIEGSWFEAVPAMLTDSILPDFFEIEYDSPAPVWRVAKIAKMLARHGYRLVLREGDNAVYKRVTA